MWDILMLVLAGLVGSVAVLSFFPYHRRVSIFHKLSSAPYRLHIEEVSLPGSLWWALFNIGTPHEGADGPKREHISSNGYRVKVIAPDIIITTPDGSMVSGSIESGDCCRFFLPRFDGSKFEPRYELLTLGDPGAVHRRFRPYTFDLNSE
jgi:hypothetical protein